MTSSDVLHHQARHDRWPEAAPSVRRLSRALGAVVEGVDLRRATPATIGKLRQLLVEHQVIFLPGQHLDEDAFTAVARHFGTLAIHPLQRMLGQPRSVSTIEDSAARPPAGFGWHTDLSWLAQPPRFGFLQALEIPPYGGDTMWASLVAAYDLLSPVLQSLCADLTAVHCIDASFRETVERLHGAQTAARLDAAHPPVAHPLVRRHPERGEPTLWLSPLYFDGIVELDPAESSMLASHLVSRLDDPNIAVRWHWTEGDIAIWDESCTVHRALVDHHDLTRRMRRCTTEGRAPESFQVRPVGAQA